MSVASSAVTDAAEAAERAGIVVEPVVAIRELDELRATMEGVWGPEVVPPRNLLRGLALGGACLLLARRDGAPVGFALGWLGWAGGVHLHSHQVGVDRTGRGSGVGLALKLAQRALCLERGIVEMRWTFDPLLAANARFNLVRLGVDVVDFLPDCYGARRDAFNTGDVTDRLKVSWRLDRAVGGELLVPESGQQVIPLPADHHRLRVDDVERADEWRRTTAAALAQVFAAGRTIVGMSEVGYVVGPR